MKENQFVYIGTKRPEVNTRLWHVWVKLDQTGKVAALKYDIGFLEKGAPVASTRGESPLVQELWCFAEQELRFRPQLRTGQITTGRKTAEVIDITDRWT